MSKIRFLKIRVYYFDELGIRTQLKVKQRLLSYFKDYVKEDTLFLSNGTILNNAGLKFLGLSDFEILKGGLNNGRKQ
jgi:hypothetical protein